MSFECELCLTERSFSTRGNRNKHYREKHNVHKLNPAFAKDAFNFKCLDCNCSFPKSCDFITHLQTAHSQTILEERKEFQSMEEFSSWKYQTEKEEQCFYTSCGGKKHLSSGAEVQYFTCSRGGRQRSRKKATEDIINRKRRTKNQGSSKLNYLCISKITLTKEDDKFFMKRILNHYGHSKDLEHLRISQADREKLATQLMQGVPSDRILDDTGNKVKPNLKRIDLLTRQDLRNIKRSYKIKVQEEVQLKDDVAVESWNDAVGVESWVQKCKTSEANPVLLYKPEGQPCKANENFKDEDFCLIVMNEVQTTLLTEFGSKLIAIDSTQGLNNYHFEMVTVMVLDDFNVGFPVAFMFSNRKGLDLINVFFKTIKRKVGVISCEIFMSDITNLFYNAWVEVMNVPSHHLLCSWLVDRSWRTNLNKIRTKDKRVWVYKTLNYLQKATDIDTKFNEELQDALNTMLQDDDIKDFGKYFLKFYSNNFQKWAFCFHKSYGLETDQTLDSMHKVVRYFNSKCIKKLDESLHATLKYVREKTVDRAIKLTKGKRSINKQENFKRHKSALLQTFLMSQKSSYTWSITQGNHQYIVQRFPNSEKCCLFDCEFCEVCVHQYSCSCPDYFTSASVMCEHIHFVAFNNQSNNSNIDCKTDTLFTEESDSNMDYDKKELILEELSELRMLVGNQDSNNFSDRVFEQIMVHLQTAKEFVLELPSTSENCCLSQASGTEDFKIVIPQSKEQPTITMENPIDEYENSDSNNDIIYLSEGSSDYNYNCK